MGTIKVQQILSVKLNLLKTNPPSLKILAKGENQNNNYQNVRLSPIVEIAPPADGVWQFDMIGEVPEFVDSIVTEVSAPYRWKDIPETLKGVRVNGIINNVTTNLKKK